MSSKQSVNITFFVAKNGNDSWSGKLAAPNKDKTDGPFASITRARDAIRELKKNQGELKEPIIVMVRGGKYFLPETITFTAEDSGTKECPITYKTYPEEKVILSGGRIIKNWKKFNQNIWVTDLPEVKEGKWKFRQLFFNGRRQIRARTPNYDPNNPLYGGWAFVNAPAIPMYQPGGSKTTLEYKAGIFRHWSKPTQGEINIFPRYGWWNDVIPIKKIDEKRRIITLAKDASYELRKGDRFYVENLLETLDNSGEWYLDSEIGKLYFWPPTGSIKETDDVIAPKLNKLISLQGKMSSPVKYINIIGFTFTETLCSIDNSRDRLDSAAIYLEGTENCSVEDNYFYAVGASAISLKGYNVRDEITGNEISYAGREAICLAGTKKEHPLRNTISYNHIHHCGVILTGGGGAINLSLSANNLISHNLVHDLPRIGISITDYNEFGGTGEDIPNCAHNIVEYNKLYHLNLETCDTGGIYTNYRGKLKEGNIIRYNIVKDMVGCHTTPEGKFLIPHFSWGIYLDDYSSNTTVYGNIVIGNVLGGIYIHGGKNNLIENNIIVNGSDSQLTYSNIDDYMSGNKFVRNIVYYTNPKADLIRIYGWTKQALAESDYNIFFHEENKNLIIKGIPKINSFADWQKIGFDTHSIIADPLFADIANDNYSLKSNSPALKLGFKPINISKISLKK